MLTLQSGLKYRHKIEQKLSLAARQPKGELCDLDPIEEQIFQDKTPAEIAEEVRDLAAESANGSGNKKKSKNKKRKKNQDKAGTGGDMFQEILNGSDDD